MRPTKNPKLRSIDDDYNEPSDPGCLPDNGDTGEFHVVNDYRKIRYGFDLMGYDPEPGDQKAPKLLMEQMSNTSRGRVMQMLAEERVDEIDNTFSIKTEEERGEEQKESELQGTIAEGVQSIKDGTITLSELEKLKKALNDVAPSTIPEVRKKQLRAVNALLTQIDKILPAVEEIEEGAREFRVMERMPEFMSNALSRLARLNQEARKAIRKKQWNDLYFFINPHLVNTAREVWKLFDILRRRDADRLYSLAHEIGQNSPLRNCKTNVIDFVGTHNSFNFSPQTIRQISNENSKFADALCEAYQNRPEQDDVFTFLQKTTHIPSARLQRIMSKAA